MPKTYTVTYGNSILDSGTIPANGLTLKYNGSTIGTITEAGIKKLPTLGKLGLDNIIIDNKVLACKNKVFTNDIAITTINADPLEGFTYTGTYNANYVYNEAGDTCLALLGSGTLTLANSGSLDVFMVGGGGSGGTAGRMSRTSGYTNGQAGGTTSIAELSLTAAGGAGGSASSATSIGQNTGGTGYGGAGGNGYSMNINGTAGIRAFNDNDGIYFASGGGGAGADGTSYGTGGGAGGSEGGYGYSNDPRFNPSAGSAVANRGGGGGGNASSSKSGYRCAATGGAGGYYSNTTQSVTSGSTYTVVIGGGGSAVSAACCAQTGKDFYVSSGYGGSGIVLLRAAK